MKAVILAGGYGSRISEETEIKPKPMIEIGGKPILWHIMKTYTLYGITDFIICLGYKGYLIKEYFSNYFLHMSDVTFDIKNNNTTIHENYSEPWKVTLVDTGEKTMTGGRLKRIQNYIDDTFCLTYGDGLIDMNISESINFHKQNNFVATVTAVQPSGRFGALTLQDNKVTVFKEKAQTNSSWINGGYFVMEPSFFNYLDDDNTILERKPLENLAKEGNLGVFKHTGFWQPMDTLREKKYLEKLWLENKAYWKKWQKNKNV